MLPWKPWNKSCCKKNDQKKMKRETASKAAVRLVSLVREWYICTWMLIVRKHDGLFFFFFCRGWVRSGAYSDTSETLLLVYFMNSCQSEEKKTAGNSILDLTRFLWVKAADSVFPAILNVQQSDFSHEQSAVWAQRTNMLIFTSC